MRDPSRLFDVAARLEADILALEQAKAAALTRAERRPINKQLHCLRGMLGALLLGFETSTQAPAPAHAREGERHGHGYCGHGDAG